MIKAVRKDIEKYLPGNSRDNLSLLFNRLCPVIDDPREKEQEHKAANQVLVHLESGYSKAALELYKYAFNQWRWDMDAVPDVLSFFMVTTAPLVIGVGEQNVHEFGLILQAPWATPVIPGTAVKGLLSSYAHEHGGKEWHKGSMATRNNGLSPISGENSLNLFGGVGQNDKTFAGLVDFFSA